MRVTADQPLRAGVGRLPGAVESDRLQPSRIGDDAEKGKLGRQPLDDRDRGVGAAAVEHQDLELVARKRVVEQRAQAGFDVARFVERRDDDGEEHPPSVQAPLAPSQPKTRQP